MKYRVVMELEFDDTITAESVEIQIEHNLGPMVRDTHDKNPDSPLLSGNLTVERIDDGR